MGYRIKIKKIASLLTVLAFLFNAATPFAAKAANTDGKIPICSAYGIIYLDAKSDTSRSAAVNFEKHCSLCFLSKLLLGLSNPPATTLAYILPRVIDTAAPSQSCGNRTQWNESPGRPRAPPASV